MSTYSSKVLEFRVLYTRVRLPDGLQSWIPAVTVPLLNIPHDFCLCVLVAPSRVGRWVRAPCHPYAVFEVRKDMHEKRADHCIRYRLFQPEHCLSLLVEG